jgi:UDPglucose 6-dehydrogenase/GDP-mannose 6-dehydrogenase
MRESPAIPIVRRLLAEKAQVAAYDPAAAEEARRIFGDEVRITTDLGEAILDADAVVLVTRWAEFEQVPDLLARSNKPPVLVDGRRMLDKEKVAQYEGIGL